MTSILCLGLLSLQVLTASPGNDVHRFQFGSAKFKPVDGFVRISEKDGYSPGKPGWVGGSPQAAHARGWQIPAGNDFAYGPVAGGDGAGTFRCDLPNGDYRVVLFFSDPQKTGARAPFDVYANGEKKLSEVRAIRTGFQAFSASVSDSRLQIRFVPTPGKNRTKFWLINALVVAPESSPRTSDEELFFTEVPPPATPNPASPSETDRARGYQLWCHNPLDLVYPATLPPAGQAAPRLNTFGCPGQTTSLTFSVRGLRDLGSPAVSVRWTKAGSSPQATVQRVWVRSVHENGSRSMEFAHRPDALLPLAPAKLSDGWSVDYAVESGKSQTYWITVTLPEGLVMGTYEGIVEFAAAGVPSCQVPLAVTVLPFVLPQPPQYTGLYWSRKSMAYPDLVEKDFAGMHSHGVRAVAIGSPLGISQVDGKPQVDCSLLTADLELARNAGLTGEIPFHCGALTGRIGDRRPADPGYDELYAQVVADVTRQLKARDLSGILWYPVDEPGNSPDRLEAAHRWLGVTKKVPGARTYCTPNSIKTVHELAGLLDVCCIQQQSVNPDTVASARQNGATLYFYTSAHDGDRLPRRLRFLNGLFLYKSGAQAIFYWHYQTFSDDPLNSLDGGCCDYNLCHPSINGPIATLGWEEIREGNNDIAFFHHLASWIERAEKSGGAEALAAAKRARKWQAKMLDSFVLDGKLVSETWPKIPSQAYDGFRRAAALLICDLMAALGQLSPQQKAVGESLAADVSERVPVSDQK
jgi:hypothetical protein